MSVKYGIIGCGAIAQRRHIPECIANPDSKLVGLADPVKERVEELAAKYGAKAYTDYKEMLKDRTSTRSSSPGPTACMRSRVSTR